jgi:ComF family protein
LNLTKSILDPILEFIYPPVCLACNADLSADERLVCNGCWKSIQVVSSGDNLFKEFTAKLTDEGVVSAVVSPFYFEKEGRLQSIIHALKYEEYTSLGVMAGRFVGQSIEHDKRVSQADFLIPVPLHPTKQRERGYNQAYYVCLGIAEVTRTPIRSDLLCRRKYTVSQTQLSFEERRENVGDAFEVRRESRDELAGRSCILVDDVITTGSTINACARELQNAGAKDVHAAAIALAKPS